MKFPIVEIFSSIQGEGVNLGKPANFIRFAGCNLNCPLCDTTWDKANAKLTVEEILSSLDKEAKLVVLTGGEPLLQPHLTWLIANLKSKGYEIAIETNGSFPTDQLKLLGVHVACSPKPQNNWKIHADCLYDELKFVVDGQFSEEVIPTTLKPIWLQPEGGNMQNAWKEALEIQKRALKQRSILDIRIGVQLHKIMEVR